MTVDDLVAAAIAQLDRRPGHTVAAAVALDNGDILTGIALDNLNAAATLCAETGPICQAYTLGRAVTATACVSTDTTPPTVLAPCGTCQERLAIWGPDVQVAVATADGWTGRTLREVNPYYWGTAFAADGGWPSAAEHRD